MKMILFFLFPVLFFTQQKEDWTVSMQVAMKNIQNKDFSNAIKNLDKSLKIYPKNPSALYFKGYLQIIDGQTDDGCLSLTNAIFYNSNSGKKLFAEKCINYDPKLNVEKFKTGNFTLQILNDDFTTYNFTRKNNMQYETFEGKTYPGKIIWLKNGDYTLIPDDEAEKEIIDYKNFFTRVLKIEGNQYLYEKIEENQIQFGIIKKTE